VKGEEAEKLSAEEVSHLTVKIDKVTTNLANIEFMIQISFAFQLSNEKAKEEFELLQHLANAQIIKILSDTEPEDIRGSKGQDLLIAKLMNSINPILQEGVISQIDITEFILSEL
jgi:flagellar FliL protein